MAPVTIILVFVAGILLFGALGAPFVRRATPALVGTPRAAVAVLSATAAFWLLALAAVGPMVAWVISGPAVLMPGTTGEICQRCLAAANPLPQGTAVDTIVPVLLLILLPLLLAGALLFSLARYSVRRKAAMRSTCQSLNRVTSSTHLLGYQVLVVNDPAPVAFALPKKRCGMVISQKLLNLLDEDELHAVLAHESAHLRQRHHLILLLVEGLTRPLRWVPLIRAIADAIPHYLEIAADCAARRETGTPALASALLKLGDRAHSLENMPQTQTDSLVLNAAGTDRIRHLVAPSSHRGGRGYLVAVMVTIALMTTTSTAVHGNYIQAALAGCAF
ncbi:M56 family metallopeptidase [Nesterenkonia sp. MY13]|uniref:M56 family metallopeptidase n=1 Tax=Nesterenkonia sedimenti TaxID=1463632 RepID=A0A7X8TI53_9MICC|nr:M56 family metallopeptidase [Nesterenkonia sedimenti]NLS08473.1 M56 family metallopeptidase [Nesterenkonia sedimenti]